MRAPLAKAAALAALAWLASGCSRVERGPQLLTEPPAPGPERVELTALLPNVVIEAADGCIAARSAEAPGGRHVLVFPAGFRLGRVGEGSAMAIFDASGRAWARIGETRTLGGGEVPGPKAAADVGCTGPFWRVATTAAPTLSAPKRPPPRQAEARQPES